MVQSFLPHHNWQLKSPNAAVQNTLVQLSGIRQLFIFQTAVLVSFMHSQFSNKQWQNLYNT